MSLPQVSDSQKLEGLYQKPRKWWTLTIGGYFKQRNPLLVPVFTCSYNTHKTLHNHLQHLQLNSENDCFWKYLLSEILDCKVSNQHPAVVPKPKSLTCVIRRKLHTNEANQLSQNLIQMTTTIFYWSKACKRFCFLSENTWELQHHCPTHTLCSHVHAHLKLQLRYRWVT